MAVASAFSGRVLLALFLAALSLSAFVGCGEAPAPRFHINLVELKRFENPDDAKSIELIERQEPILANVLEAMFGTPDEPFVLPEAGLDMGKLKMAAGPTAITKDGAVHGLYREHCVHCHGISGDGAGPTAAFLKPYPRDYRLGKFKFKSTDGQAKPTDSDLHKIIAEGIPGTAMPSFKLLPAEQIDALVEYVKYLAIRGETELTYIRTLPEQDEGADLPTDREVLVDELLTKIGTSWKDAPKRVIKVPPRPTGPDFELARSLELGRELFYSNKGTCLKCHGAMALGDGGQENFDDWNKPLKPDDSDVAYGALPRRENPPRNLRSGVYRGGRRPVDIYYRVHAGINGSGMPGFATALTSDEIWHIVDYVRSLPYEPDGELALPRETSLVQRNHP